MQFVRLPEVIRKHERVLRFCFFFVVAFVVAATVFENLKGFFATTYMYPISYVATLLLNLISIPAELDIGQLPNGFCELVLRGLVYKVTFDCTGIFALLVYFALTVAYPVSHAKKAEALIIGGPAIFIFSALRLLVLGVVGALEPRWIDIFHVYVMELATLGFMLFVWKSWINRVAD